MAIERFEDIIAWQKARALARDVYLCTREEPFRRDYGLCGQIQRASVSIMSNIAEGFERDRLTEFHQFLSVAKGSCAEVRSHLYVALDIGYISEPHFLALREKAEEVTRIVAGLRSSVQRQIADNHAAPH